MIGDPEPAVGDRAGDTFGVPDGVAGWRRLPTSPSRRQRCPRTTRRAGSPAVAVGLPSPPPSGGLELVGAGLGPLGPARPARPATAGWRWREGQGWARRCGAGWAGRGRGNRAGPVRPGAVLAALVTRGSPGGRRTGRPPAPPGPTDGRAAGQSRARIRSHEQADGEGGEVGVKGRRVVARSTWSSGGGRRGRRRQGASLAEGEPPPQGGGWLSDCGCVLRTSSGVNLVNVKIVPWSDLVNDKIVHL